MGGLLLALAKEDEAGMAADDIDDMMERWHAAGQSAASDQWVDLHVVMKATSLSKSTIERRVKDGAFPASFKVPGMDRNRWSLLEVNAWMAKAARAGASLDTDDLK